MSGLPRNGRGSWLRHMPAEALPPPGPSVSSPLCRGTNPYPCFWHSVPLCRQVQGAAGAHGRAGRGKTVTSLRCRRGTALCLVCKPLGHAEISGSIASGLSHLGRTYLLRCPWEPDPGSQHNDPRIPKPQERCAKLVRDEISTSRE